MTRCTTADGRLFARASAVVPDRWAQEAKQLLPRGELAVLPGYAHVPRWSGPRALAPVLRPLLSFYEP